MSAYATQRSRLARAADCLFAENPLKTVAGKCGCASGDADADGVEDCLDHEYDIVMVEWPLQVDIYDPDALQHLVGRVAIPSNALRNSSAPVRLETFVQSDVKKFNVARVPNPTRYGWALNLSVVSRADGSNERVLERDAQICLEPASGHSAEENLCLAVFLRTINQWHCIDNTTSATNDGLVCGSVPDFQQSRSLGWSLWTVMDKKESGSERATAVRLFDGTCACACLWCRLFRQNWRRGA